MDEQRAPGWINEPREDDGRPIEDPGEGARVGEDEGLPAPIDIRDTYGNAAPGVGNARGTEAADVEMPEAGPYPLPEVVERPFAAAPPGAMPGQPTPDPSLSRAVDRAAAGIDASADGFDRAAEGPPPGPLGPDAALEDADAEGEPAGQYGSSGSRGV